MEQLIKNLKANTWFMRIGLPVLGAIGGYAYYHFIGCYSGTCPISSNPLISTIYGGVIGLLFIPRKKKQQPE